MGNTHRSRRNPSDGFKPVPRGHLDPLDFLFRDARTLNRRRSQAAWVLYGPRRGWVNDPHRFAAMALGEAESSPHSSVERFNRRVENPPGGVEVAGAKGVRIAGKARPGIGEGLGADGPPQGAEERGAVPSARSRRPSSLTGNRHAGLTRPRDRPKMSRASTTRQIAARGETRDRMNESARPVRRRWPVRAARFPPGGAGGSDRPATPAIRAVPAQRRPGGP